MAYNRAQRQHLSDKLMDTANLVLGGLVVGQLVDRTVHLLLIVAGFLFFVATVMITTHLRKGG